MSTPVYQVLFEPDEDNWLVVSVPSVQGCRTCARSVEQGLERIREALTLFVEEPFELEVIEKK